MSRVLWFGVRHHSPTAARLVAELVRAERPVAVLVEGPSDASGLIAELAAQHVLPIAVYTWAVVPAADGVTPGRRGAFYPFGVWSPEWQALVTGLEVGAECAFIDLPWTDLAALPASDETQDRWSDDELAGSRFVGALCERLQVESFDDAWDLLVEVDATTDLATYLERSELVGAGLRPLVPSAADATREACMAREVLAALERHPTGAVLVVTGAFHTTAVRALVEGGVPDGLGVPTPARAGDGRGAALTPSSYESLDALTGYGAGQRHPGFYDRVWHDRRGGIRPGEAGGTADRLLVDVATTLREQGQAVSAADLIAASTTARALARLRGHAEVWRTDLVDGITGSLVKDALDAHGGHPLLSAVRRALRGDAVGRLAEGSPVPPLVAEVKTRLEERGLTLTTRETDVRADLASDDGLDTSRLLHALELLDVPGAALVRAADLGGLVAGGDRKAGLVETWRLRWQPRHESALVEAAAYGSTLVDAVSARLLERAVGLQRDSLGAVQLLVGAALAGMDEHTGPLQDRAAALLATDPDLGAVGQSLALLMRLFRYDPVLRTTGRADLGALVVAGADHGTALLRRLGSVTDGKAQERAAGAVRTLLDVHERSGRQLGLSRDGFDEALALVAGDPGQAPLLRGAAVGARWLLGSAGVSDLVDGVRGASGVAQPDDVGDHLSGLLTVAREAVTRREEVLQAVDEVVRAWSPDEFLLALPALRRAFTTLTPREREIAAEKVAGGTVPVPVAVEDAAAVLAAEQQLLGTLRRWGLREPVLQ